jgi:putative membrane protein
MARHHRVLREATISPAAARYSTFSLSLVFVVSIVTIPLLPILIPFTAWYYRRFYRALSVTLTSRELIVRRGLWVRTESTIPLEKVTDVGMVEGPLMRRHGVKGLRVETAGQTGAAGIGLVSIVGIENPDDFRDAVLDQRDKVSDRDDGGMGSGATSAPGAASAAALGATGTASGTGTDPEVVALLREIRDHVSRIG